MQNCSVIYDRDLVNTKNAFLNLQCVPGMQINIETCSHKNIVNDLMAGTYLLLI